MKVYQVIAVILQQCSVFSGISQSMRYVGHQASTFSINSQVQPGFRDTLYCIVQAQQETTAMLDVHGVLKPKLTCV